METSSKPTPNGKGRQGELENSTPIPLPLPLPLIATYVQREMLGEICNVSRIKFLVTLCLCSSGVRYRKASPVESGGKEYRFVKGGEGKKKDQKKKEKKNYSMNLATDVISVIGNCRVLSTANY